MQNLFIELKEDILKIENDDFTELIIKEVLNKLILYKKLFKIEDEKIICNFKNVKVAKRIFEKDSKIVNEALKNLLKRVKNEQKN